MPVRVPDVVYAFDNGETLHYSAFAAHEIERFAAETPGLYAWYYRLRGQTAPAASTDRYTALFASKRVRVDLSAELGERYSGHAARVPERPPIPRNSDALLQAASAAFSPPLYIGVSVNVRRRLLEHYAGVHERLVNPNRIPGADLLLGSAEVDTDAESSVFAARISQLISIQEIGSLFVKVVYEPELARADLVAVEYYLNRTYLPTCGRR